MEYLVGDTYGLIHLISSISSLLKGTLVLILKKGTINTQAIWICLCYKYGYFTSHGIYDLPAF